MTKTITANFDGPNRGYNFLTDDTGEESLATGRQKRALTNLIFQNIDEDKRDDHLKQLDEITKAEASDWIIEFTMGRWK